MSENSTFGSRIGTLISTLRTSSLGNTYFFFEYGSHGWTLKLTRVKLSIPTWPSTTNNPISEVRLHAYPGGEPNDFWGDFPGRRRSSTAVRPLPYDRAAAAAAPRGSASRLRRPQFSFRQCAG